MGMKEQTPESNEQFTIALREQKERVISAVTESEIIPATPILRGNETLCCEEYVTLVYELHHVHLPELEADGFVTFDRDGDVIQRGKRL